MPRKARIDALGALHHIVVRRVARKKVFDNADRYFLVERLGLIQRFGRLESSPRWYSPVVFYATGRQVNWEFLRYG